MSEITHWDFRFMHLAHLISSWSKDPNTRVGAVIVDKDNRIVSIGYNGLPKGISDKDEILQDRDLKNQMIIHAERNALLFAESSRLLGSTIYTWPFPSCSQCTSLFIQVGIAKTVAPSNYPPSWLDSIILGERMKFEAGIEDVKMTTESLKDLFPMTHPLITKK